MACLRARGLSRIDLVLARILEFTSVWVRLGYADVFCPRVYMQCFAGLFFLVGGHRDGMFIVGFRQLPWGVLHFFV
jgi:hypothetical protein